MKNLSFEEKVAIIEKLGWTLECESPLEISHSDGTFARGLAAEYTIDGLIADNEELITPEDFVATEFEEWFILDLLATAESEGFELSEEEAKIYLRKNKKGEYLHETTKVKQKAWSAGVASIAQKF